MDTKAIVISHYPPNTTKQYSCNMSNIAKTDGNYKLDYKLATNIYISKTFGYYTNGIPMEKKVSITFKNDTIIFD